MVNKRILLVEDDPVLLKIYTDILSVENYSLETVSDGEIALEKIKNGGWDLVLLDFVLPTMNALEILEKLKSEPALTPNKAIVLLTNLEQDADFQKALKMVNGHIIKSNVNPEELLNKVKSFLHI